MKAVALVVSARKHGNCYDFAKFSLARLQDNGIETELINFDDFQITPCQHCEYECIQHVDKLKGFDSACPIQDDVRMIWEKTWQAEILLIFIPNYGGLPPALWFAFSQRVQSLFRQAPADKLKKSVVSAVVLAAPHQSSGAPWIYSLMGDEIKGLDRVVAGFEIINPTEYKIEYSFNPLINDIDIQRRLVFLTEHTLQSARDIAIEV